MGKFSESTVDVLTLGSGWVGNYLVTELDAVKLTHRSTSRDGTNNSIPFNFDPESNDSGPCSLLPNAKTIVIIFPIIGSGSHAHLIKLYNKTHPNNQARWIQLGSTSAFDLRDTERSQSLWRDRHSPVDTSKARVLTEVELLALPGVDACVLNLAGLWGGTRDMRRYVGHVAPTKEALRAKGSLHMIHGKDVARCIVAVHEHFRKGRYLLTDMRVYDWWELASAWGSLESPEKNDHALWVLEFMHEKGLHALPRSPSEMGGNALDSREFWADYKHLRGPMMARLEKEML